MAIKSSSKTVREMKATLQKTTKEIEGIRVKVQSASNKSADWDDAQGKQYQALMKRIAQLTQSPMATLNAAVPKLEKLAVALEKYERTKF